MKELVLLVEDDPDDLELTLAAFDHEGFLPEIQVARDGEEALARLRGPERAPALVLLDLNIPKISGLEVLSRLREDRALAGTNVVVLSSSDDAREKRAAAELGALAFLRKPFGLAEFAGIVRELNSILSRLRKMRNDPR